MSERDVYFQAAIGPCDQFLCEGKKQTIQVVIAPLKVIEEENAVKANYGCNMWKSCEQRHCQYSQVSKGPKTK